MPLLIATVTSSAARTEDLRLVKRSDARDSETSAGKPLLLGHLDLIRLASFAITNEFSVLSFLLFDSSFGLLPPEDQELTNDELLATLRSYGQSELIAQLEDEFPNLTIVGIKIRHNLDGAVLDIKKNGFVSTQATASAQMFMTKAWRELRLK
ncbi:hypothetical protein [uncultured Brachybacterium sp.]|uniref:hypothetical protein n=1 Tax=uncultured Brachybacterium sp. TaxID=189680 RepID=UPI002612EFC4|nr:hypothetical protein [uncultured Brachybacterium sp.]